MNVPRNVTVFLEQNDLVATWEKPLSTFPKGCFEYEFYLINLKSGNEQVIASPLPEHSILFLTLTVLYCVRLQQDEGGQFSKSSIKCLKEESKANFTSFALKY